MTLDEMTVTEAASKALEVLAYKTYNKYYAENNLSFEDYLHSEFSSKYEDDPFTMDTDRVWQEFKHEGSTKPVTYDGFSANVVAEFGGEGEGDQYWMVISVSDGETTRYFRRDGWYASYDGGYLDGDTYEVKPAEKTITVYE